MQIWNYVDTRYKGYNHWIKKKKKKKKKKGIELENIYNVHGLYAWSY